MRNEVPGLCSLQFVRLEVANSGQTPAKQGAALEGHSFPTQLAEELDEQKHRETTQSRRMTEWMISIFKIVEY